MKIFFLSRSSWRKEASINLTKFSGSFRVSLQKVENCVKNVDNNVLRRDIFLTSIFYSKAFDFTNVFGMMTSLNFPLYTLHQNTHYNKRLMDFNYTLTIFHCMCTAFFFICVEFMFCCWFFSSSLMWYTA